MMATDYNPLPAPGDIVWCFFPQVLGKPGPKPRPAIVLALSRATHEVMVAYGTSQKVHKIYPTEFVIDPNDAGYSISGLSYRTKFNLADRHKLPFNSDWFGAAPGLSASLPLPKMGTLHATYMKAASAAQKAALQQL